MLDYLKRLWLSLVGTTEKVPFDLKTLEKMYLEDPVQLVKHLREVVESMASEEEDITEDATTTFRQTWENTIHLERVQPLQYLRPTSKKELIKIVQDATAMGVMVRAVGKGHSFSDVANATDFLVDMLELNKVLELDDTLKPHSDAYVCCEAGMMVEDLNEALDQMGLALPTMAAFDQETIYGAIATSTHGTGIRVDGMSDMVASMELVADNGKCYRLEPANGITDPIAFNTKYSGDDYQLIQNDDKFHSAVVGFGLMGLVYSIIIQPVKTFYLEQRVWITNWSTVRPMLEDGSFFTIINHKGDHIAPNPDGTSPPTRAQVTINPYKTAKKWDPQEDHTCAVQVQTEISKERFETLQARESKHPHQLEHFLEEVLTNGSHGTTEETVAHEDKDSTVAEWAAKLILLVLNKHPHLTPLMNEITIISLLSRSGKIGKSYDVYNQGTLAFKNAGYSVEPGVPVNDQHSYLKAVDEIMATVTLSKTSEAYLTAPLCLRFVKANNDYLSPEYGADTCMIEIPSLIGATGAVEMLDRMQLNLLPYGARPHWGKICSMINGAELVADMYPKFPEFVKTVNYFNKSGTFNSIFSYRTGMTKLEFES